jgi:hypothetical protein
MASPSSPWRILVVFWLAERIEDDATRANLIKLVRAWLTAAKEIEKAGSNVLVQISAQL